MNQTLADDAGRTLFARWIGPAVVGGLGTAVAMWCAWFITHLPALGLPAPVLGPVLILLVAAGGFVTGRASGSPHSWKLGALAGLVSGAVNLMLVGSKIVEPAAGGTEPGQLRPAAGLIVAGFLLLCIVLGAVGGALGKPRVTSPASTDRAWLGRLSLVAVVAFLPLMLIGGLVTSTSSGMAVPDWPGSYGANMFLYPIGLMSHERIFLEHTHRLFGSMVGLTTVALLLGVLGAGPRGTMPRRVRLLLGVVLFVLTAVAFFAGVEWVNARSAGMGAPLATVLGLLGACAAAWGIATGGEGARLRAWAVGLFLVVCVQGFLGGMRVTENSPTLAMVHGVLAQLLFAGAAAVAMSLSATAELADRAAPVPLDRRRRLVASALIAALVIQLLFGAMYRHLQSMHPLWTHAAFSLVVVALAVLAGSLAMSRRSGQEVDRPLRRLGAAVHGLVGLQFVLGWIAFYLVITAESRGPVPTHQTMDQTPMAPAYDVLLRTAHQANGAVLLAVAAAMATLIRRLPRA
jgi:cytochrome c oxidase assembly protein subunit 15